ncbi:murein hydrolase activator EnvC family protein [Fictibacillus aquaticus]|uniref:Uncharacterized protein n=1 Tax=Fictibacillus aquaticus TaxID=2021314 RepID=A0A235F564_9BACL|nr:M23 family metallopeptidase [Fictibacillus aquaticus]OYD56067.1 hypothetical protein CGZ90_19490 [Fictibacillus aquaticus]
MKKRVTTAAALLVLQLGLGNSHSIVSAASLSELQQKKEKNANERNVKKREIDDVRSEQRAVSNDIKRLDANIFKTTKKLVENNQEINTINKSIETIRKEISAIETRIAERDKLLKERVTVMYETGGASSYLEVILGSSSFGNFLDRVIALNLIADQDQTIIDAHTSDKKTLEGKKAEVEIKLQKLNQTIADLQTLKVDLDRQRNQKNKIMSNLKQKEGVINSYILNLKEKNDILNDQEKTIRAEMARSNREAEVKSDKQNQSEPVTQAGPSLFLFPTEGVITSRSGQRWGKEHAGIDVAKSGTVSVNAAASGTVLRSYYSSSYGNVVFLTHFINGQLYTTVYAHMNSRSVSSGQTVSKGEQLGYQGNTGRSTGQHLHFELHKGEWNISKSNAIDPLPLLSK